MISLYKVHHLFYNIPIWKYERGPSTEKIGVISKDEIVYVVNESNKTFVKVLSSKGVGYIDISFLQKI